MPRNPAPGKPAPGRPRGSHPQGGGMDAARGWQTRCRCSATVPRRPREPDAADDATICDRENPAARTLEVSRDASKVNRIPVTEFNDTEAPGRTGFPATIGPVPELPESVARSLAPDYARVASAICFDGRSSVLELGATHSKSLVEHRDPWPISREDLRPPGRGRHGSRAAFARPRGPRNRRSGTGSSFSQRASPCRLATSSFSSTTGNRIRASVRVRDPSSRRRAKSRAGTAIGAATGAVREGNAGFDAAGTFGGSSRSSNAGGASPDARGV